MKKVKQAEDNPSYNVKDLELSFKNKLYTNKALKLLKVWKPKIEKRDKIWVTKGFWKDGTSRVIYCSSWSSASFYAQKSREWWEGS